jgi:hypothetical protein
MSRAVTVNLMALICVLLLSLAPVRPTVIHAQHSRLLTTPPLSAMTKQVLRPIRS